ncbi:PLD nuclease N-terminal domain-containing protein [Streptomyces griseosporeus]|uniref:PLD nuclease N-terminal domain-containing protein n=1 Tax=Streptomyces griseosporeus TaxID=1910 RepID=UPI0036FF6FBD
MLRYLPFLLVLALWIYAFIDCLNTPEEEVRGLPKVVWVIVILLFGEVLVGPVAWLVAGKNRAPRAVAGGGAARWVAPDDNPEFLKSLEKDLGKDLEKDLDTDKDRRDGGEDG